MLSQKVRQEAWIIWGYIGALFTLLIYVWAASQASRTLVEARRSGLLELLLVTPLSVRQIVGGQWHALWRLFGIPVLLLVGLHVAGGKDVGFILWSRKRLFSGFREQASRALGVVPFASFASGAKRI